MEGGGVRRREEGRDQGVYKVGSIINLYFFLQFCEAEF